MFVWLKKLNRWLDKDAFLFSKSNIQSRNSMDMMNPLSPISPMNPISPISIWGGETHSQSNEISPAHNAPLDVSPSHDASPGFDSSPSDSTSFDSGSSFDGGSGFDAGDSSW